MVQNPGFVGAMTHIKGVPIFDWLIKAAHAYHLGEPVPALEPGG
jgi:hypothetical protein